jgi:hypothetical protein
MGPKITNPHITNQQITKRYLLCRSQLCKVLHLQKVSNLTRTAILRIRDLQNLFADRPTCAYKQERKLHTCMSTFVPFSAGETVPLKFTILGQRAWRVRSRDRSADVDKIQHGGHHVSSPLRLVTHGRILDQLI